MQLTLYPYLLQFKFPFKIAHGVRTHTSVVYVKLAYQNHIAWGEATLPPYLPETQASVIDFITQFAKQFDSKNSLQDWFNKLEKEEKNLSAKAALDMALWNLKALVENKSIGELLGIKSFSFPLCTFTIGVCNKAEMEVKITSALAHGFELFKLKLDGEHDEEMVNNFTALCNHTFAVDVNQGWATYKIANQKIDWLANHNCMLVEQPLPKAMLHEMDLVNKHKRLPIYADESCQRLSDIEKLQGRFEGINIKLMKCGGITEAIQMIHKANELDMKVLIGCMSESSVGCTAAAHLTTLADYADLDGPYLIANDPFTGMKIRDGKIEMGILKQKVDVHI